jgi:hypothetical protein
MYRAIWSRGGDEKKRTANPIEKQHGKGYYGLSGVVAMDERYVD